MLDGIDNLLEISIRLNKSMHIFETIRQKPGQNLNNGTSYFMIVRRKPQKMCASKTLHAVDFHSLT